MDEKLQKIQNSLILHHGSFKEELPEQKMVVQYFTGKEKVLEIGSNIGRNSLVIASILREYTNNDFVTLESDTNIAGQLRENRDKNNFQFHIENSALSKRSLIQQGWVTKENRDRYIPDGWKNVQTITLEELRKKYNIQFDTLVLDCEGALYYILMDMPEILDGISLIIMENDYHNLEHKIYVDNVLKANGFYVIYKRGGGWGPCKDNFFEVWNK